MLSSSIIISLCLCTLLTIVWKILNSFWLNPKKLENSLRAQGFNGNSYRFPFGDAQEIMSMIKENETKCIEISNDDIRAHVLPYHHHYTTLYGKNHFMWMGTKPRVNIEDPKLIKDLLSQYRVFQKENLNSLAKLVLPGLVGQEGEGWVKHRTLLNSSFHLDKLKLMVPAMYSSCNYMISNWENLLSGKDSCEIDVYPYINNLTADIISRTAFSSNYEEGKKIFPLQKEQFTIIFQSMNTIYIPGWRFLPTKSNRRIKEINCEIDALVRDIIKKKEKAIKEGKGEESNEDLLGTLVKTNLKEIEEQGNKKNVALSTEEIIDECKLFYIAGQETTALLLTWTLVLLGKNQIWQDRARDEIKAVFGDNKPEFNGLTRLKVVSMILNEVLRLYPPVCNIVRETHEKTKLGKYEIPAGTVISVPIPAIHTDNKIWGEDAKMFNPDRFSEGIAKATDEQYSFLPMSAGPRICIGQNFALLEAKLVISMILQRFSIELSPSYVHTPSPTLAMIEPHHDVLIKLNKIKS